MRARHFVIQELVCPEIFAERGERAWELLRPEFIVTLDDLRDEYGPIAVNDWHIGGTFKYSGLRPFDCPEGAKFSMHKFGAGGDAKFKRVSADKVRADVIAKPDRFPHIQAIEVPSPGKPMSWFHFDHRNVAKRIAQFPI